MLFPHFLHTRVFAYHCRLWAHFHPTEYEYDESRGPAAALPASCTVQVASLRSGRKKQQNPLPATLSRPVVKRKTNTTTERHRTSTSCRRSRIGTVFTTKRSGNSSNRLALEESTVRTNRGVIHSTLVKRGSDARDRKWQITQFPSRHINQKEDRLFNAGLFSNERMCGLRDAPSARTTAHPKRGLLSDRARERDLS